MIQNKSANKANMFLDSISFIDDVTMMGYTQIV